MSTVQVAQCSVGKLRIRRSRGATRTEYLTTAARYRLHSSCRPTFPLVRHQAREETETERKGKKILNLNLILFLFMSNNVSEAGSRCALIDDGRTAP